ncbi:MAG: response regulator transcription factor [Pseudomonadota bacterium]
MAVCIISKIHMVRDILKSTCEQRGFDIRQVCATTQDVTEIDPNDLVVLHTRRPVGEITNQVVEVRALCTECRMMIIAPENVCSALRVALDEDVLAVMPEDEPTETLVGVLAVAMQGYRVVEPSAPNGKTLKLGNGRRQQHPRSSIAATTWKSGPQVAPLSPRESAVMLKLREGGSNKDIANALGICEATVKVYLRTCYQKIGVKNRTQAAVWASERLPETP